jgi:NADH kinase
LHVYMEHDHASIPRVIPLDPTSLSSIDLVVCVGGDGTLLHASSLYQPPAPPPPCISFSTGTLGFLMPFRSPSITDPKSIAGLLDPILSNSSAYTMMMRRRLRCRYTRSDNESVSVLGLNEVVVRSMHGLLPLDLHLRNRHTHPSSLDQPLTADLTKMDGLIVASPTGSTAYSLSAGGPIVHPWISGMVITPLCPLSMSFKPFVIPGELGLEVRIVGGGAELSVDGREFGVGSGHGDEVVLVEEAELKHAIPCVVRKDDEDGWIRDLRTLLRWNQPFGKP